MNLTSSDYVLKSSEFERVKDKGLYAFNMLS